jgi:hypothetical protein
VVIVICSLYVHKLVYEEGIVILRGGSLCDQRISSVTETKVCVAGRQSATYHLQSGVCFGYGIINNKMIYT